MRKFLNISTNLIYGLIGMTLGIINIIIFYNVNNNIQIIASESTLPIRDITPTNILLLSIAIVLFLISFLLILFSTFENTNETRLIVYSSILIITGLLIITTVIVAGSILLDGLCADFSKLDINFDTSASEDYSVNILKQLFLATPSVLTVIQGIFPLTICITLLKKTIKISEDQNPTTNANKITSSENGSNNEIKNEIKKLQDQLELEELKTEYTELYNKLNKNKQNDIVNEKDKDSSK